MRELKILWLKEFGIVYHTENAFDDPVFSVEQIYSNDLPIIGVSRIILTDHEPHMISVTLVTEKGGKEVLSYFTGKFSQ